MSWWKSYRLWSAVTTAAGVILNVAPKVAAMSPLLGTIVTATGLVLLVVGATGSAAFGMTSNRAINFSVTPSVVTKAKSGVKRVAKAVKKFVVTDAPKDPPWGTA